jgi:hypothetical protein
MKTAIPLTLALLAPAAAEAALQCNYYDEFVAAAVTVIQIADTTVAPFGDASDICMLDGTVVRSFRGPIATGTLIRTHVPCRGIPGRTFEGMPGPTIYTDYAALVGAKVVEIHAGAEGGPAGHGAGIVLLPIPTDSPQYQSMCGG